MKKRMLLSCFLAFVVIGPLGHFTHAGETKVATGNPAVQANNDFACDLYRNLDKDNQEKNLFFSPYSISSALAMTLEGARGETAEEMGKVMRLPASLRGGADAKTLPWKTGPYHLGFNALNRVFNTPADELKDQAARQKLVDLRRQLDQANEQVRALEKKGKFNDPQLLKGRAQAKKLAEAINALNKQVDQFELRIANAIWGEKTYPFDPNYFDTISKYYGSGVLRNADFRGNFLGERDNINRWVLQQTKDRIKDLIPKLPPDVAKRVCLILVNAIYFKGQWATPFDAKLTKQEDFLLADGGKAKAPLMRVTNDQAHYAAFNGDGTFFETPLRISFQEGEKVKTYPERDGFLMAEVPVKGDKLSMVVIAPQKADGLSALEAGLTGPKLAAWIGKLQKRSVHVALPRFKMETDYSLGETLQAMGMKQAFNEKLADFTGMSASRSPEDRLSISKVLHKAFVEVNEKGAEAAAATAVIMVTLRSAPAALPFTPSFRADRPFFFLIRDRETGAILFLGRVTQPRVMAN